MVLFTLVNNYRTRTLSRRFLGNDRFLLYMAYGFDASLVGYLVSGFFVTVLYYPYFWVNLAFTVALRAVADREALAVRSVPPALEREEVVSPEEGPLDHRVL